MEPTPNPAPHTEVLPRHMIRAVSIDSARRAWVSAASFIGLGIMVVSIIRLVARLFSQHLDSETILSDVSQGSIGAISISIDDSHTAPIALLPFMAIAGIAMLIQLSMFVSGITAAGTSRTYLGAGMSRISILHTHGVGGILASGGIAVAAFVVALGAMAVDGSLSGALRLPSDGTLAVLGIAATAQDPLPFFWWTLPVLAFIGALTPFIAGFTIAIAYVRLHWFIPTTALIAASWLASFMEDHGAFAALGTWGGTDGTGAILARAFAILSGVAVVGSLISYFSLRRLRIRR